MLSGPLADGHVFKTGGSTSDGKLSVFRRDEWQAFVRAFGQGLGRQLLPGDRVANLFFAGDLYTSLLFIHGALSHSPAPVVEFPFTCNVEDAALADAIDTLDINVLAGVPVQLVRFASWLQQAAALTGVRCLLYGGESLFAEQLALLGRVFPNARIGSIGCASVDAGLIGAAGRIAPRASTACSTPTPSSKSSTRPAACRSRSRTAKACWWSAICNGG